MAASPLERQKTGETPTIFLVQLRQDAIDGSMLYRDLTIGMGSACCTAALMEPTVFRFFHKGLTSPAKE